MHLSFNAAPDTIFWYLTVTGRSFGGGNLYTSGQCHRLLGKRPVVRTRDINNEPSPSLTSRGQVNNEPSPSSVLTVRGLDLGDLIFLQINENFFC